MKTEIRGTIVAVTLRIDANSNLVKTVKLEVYGDIAPVVDVMRQPLKVSFEAEQLTIADVPRG